MYTDFFFFFFFFFFLLDSASVVEPDSDDLALSTDDLSKVDLMAGQLHVRPGHLSTQPQQVGGTT